MQLPLSQNRLVALALVGVLLTGGVTAVLASPGAFGAALGDGGDTGAAPAAADAPPAQNDSFTPAVQTQTDGYGDHEADEDDEEYEDEDDEEHDDEGGEYESVRAVGGAP